ncbi:hypothetical protein PsYK624_108800 [Phanerochaete sordida]|uniref:Uncharacterized protein n=1 Tax=Phanerochaete sordida TaxID=48140 RepID=A0A9P3GI44_9APHY|nr:hypothetical protein PsYK624_108800 [Phanerochaete sordida]
MSFLHRLTIAFTRRQDLLNKQGIQLLHDVTPVFEAKRRWTSRWTYTLVLTQLAVTVAGADLIFNHWTERVDPPADAPPDAKPEFRLRPVWQRIALATGEYAIGAAIAYLLINMRSRLVRRLYVLPGTAVNAAAPLAPKLRPTDRALVVQNAMHWRGQGKVFPFSTTRLDAGSTDSELLLKVDGESGAWLMALQDAKVDGEEGSSMWDLKKKLYTTWYGEKKGLKELAKHGWEQSSEP